MCWEKSLVVMDYLDSMCYIFIDAQMSGITQFIDGTRELTPDNWAAFQQEMNDMGLSRIEEIQLAAYQAMYGA